MRKIIVCLLSSLFLFVLLTVFLSTSLLTQKITHKAYATILLQDDFNDGVANGWEEYLGYQGSWRIENGEYVGLVEKVSSNDNPTYSLSGDVNWSDYRFEVKIRGDIGVDKLVLFRYHSLGETYAIKLCSTWPDWYGNKVALLKNNLINWTTSASFTNTLGIWYTLSVEARGNNIKLFINNSDVPIINYTDEISPNLTGKIGLLVWPGGYGGRYTVNRFDDVLVTTLDSPPSQPQPIVLLPGLGASWNHESMILGESQPQSEWSMTPGIKLYDGLIQTLKNAGYQTEGDDKNLFIFNYDWTRPVTNIANDLKTYIQTTVNPPPGTKIDLIGHSLGGLVARTYLQNNPDHPVDQLLTLGSPHKGAPKVYYLWEGGQIEKALEPWQRILAGLLLHLKKPSSTSAADAVHTAFPVLKDLLPTFNYLLKNSTEKPVNEMNQRNDWLIGLNNSPPNHLLNHLNAFLGNINNSTAEWIKVTDPYWIEKILGLWPDGKPTGEEIPAAGDKFVLNKSAQLSGAAVTTLNNLDHGEIVTESQAIQILTNTLVLHPSSISNASADIYNTSLVFYLASPATISSLRDPNNNPVGSIEGRMAIVYQPVNGEYKIEIVGIYPGGEYRLFVGQITGNKDRWMTIQGEINPAETKIYTINFNSTSPLTNPLVDPQGEQNSGNARAKLSDLKKFIGQQNIGEETKSALISHLNIILRLLDSNKIEKTILSLYSFRQHLNSWEKEGKISPDLNRYLKNKVLEIIDDLQQAYIILETNQGGVYDPKRLANEINTAVKIFRTMESQLFANYNQGLADADDGALYQRAFEKLQRMERSSSYEAHINALGVKHLSQEALWLLHNDL